MPHNILSLDTTQPFGSIALLRDGALAAEVEIHAPTGFSSVIYGEIQRMLDSLSITVADIDLYAVAAGPGSFTGVRVGLAVAKGLAEMHGRLVCPVSNLMAIASLVDVSLGSGDTRVPLIDVRRGEFAAAVYSAALETLVAPFSAEPADIATRVADFAPVTYCGSDVAQTFPDAVATPRALAAAIARLATTLRALDPAAADAEYVRRADVRLPVA